MFAPLNRGGKHCPHQLTLQSCGVGMGRLVLFRTFGHFCEPIRTFNCGESCCCFMVRQYNAPEWRIAVV